MNEAARESGLSQGATPAVVFGATGFIGSHVAEQLRHAGQRVLAPVRTPNAFLQGLGVEQLRIDFSSDSAIQTAIPAGSVVYCCLANPCHHLALEDLRAVEVGLTCRVIESAARAGARRVVLLSTVMVYGFTRPAQPIDEDYPPAPTYAFNAVALERELAAQVAARAAGIELAILRPVNTIGQRDRQLAPLFAAARRGVFPLFGSEDYRFSGIDTRDLGRAMILLGTLPQAAGQTWLVKGFDTSWLELKAALERITGLQSLGLRLPRPMAYGLGALIERIVPYAWEPSLTRFSVEVMATHTLFDDRKLRAAGFAPRFGLEDALRAALVR